MEKAYVIRPCRIDEIHILQWISEKTFKDTFGPQNKRQDIETYLEESFSFIELEKEWHLEGSAFYFLEEVSESGAEVIGYLKLNSGDAQTEEGFEDMMEIQRIYLLEDYKDQGLGELLLNYAIQEGKMANKQGVWLGVWEKNHEAHSFYHKYGFEKIGEHVFLLGEDVQTDDLLLLHL